MCSSRIELKKQDARKRILEVAEQLFIREVSYESATIRELARRADVSVGAVYLHFKTKADILAALVADFIDNLEHLYEGVNTNRTTGAAKLEALLNFLDLLRKDKTFKLYVHFSTLNPGVVKDMANPLHINKKIIGFCEYADQVIREGLSDGSISYKGDPTLGAFTLIALSFSFISSLLTPISNDLNELTSAGFTFTTDDLFGCFQSFMRDTFHITADFAQ